MLQSRHDPSSDNPLPKRSPQMLILAAFASSTPARCQACIIKQVTNVCCVQGLVESRQLKDREGQAYTLCLLARRSRLHPGMRYIARGLNALASPGNEIECDQVAFWRSMAVACDFTHNLATKLRAISHPLTWFLLP